MTEITEISKIQTQLSSATGDGMNLELCGESAEEKFSDGSLNPFAWFRAESEGDIRFVTSTKNGPISIPLDELEKAIVQAKIDVHSESYFENRDDDT